MVVAGIELGAADLRVLRDQIRAVDLGGASVSTFRSFERQLRGLTGDMCKIAYLGNFTLDLLPPFVNVRAAAEGILAAGRAGGIAQHMQALFDPQSDILQFAPDIMLLALSPRLLRPDAFDRLSAASADERRVLKDELLAHVEDWLQLALEQTSATLLVSNFVTPAHPALGVADTAIDHGEAELYLELNLGLLRLCRDKPRVQLVDMDRVAARVGKDRAFDPRMFHLAKMEWSEVMLREAAIELVRHVRAAKGLARKCLVLDLDNTLWGGVIGEDGPAGVKVGPGDAQGEAFAAFQSRIKALRNRGILLALCSKNNPADVDELFALRTEMPLGRGDFAAEVIGWEPKHLGLQAIARSLNIGTDGLVFVDDNPAETELIKEMMPEVEVVLLPRDPAQYVGVLNALTCFEKAVVLRDDVEKSAKYQEEKERRSFADGSGNLAAYLAGLGTKLSIREATATDLARVHQLVTKTNQFNLTTRRHDLGAIERFVASPDHQLFVAAASDRFGDLGQIAVALLVREDGNLVIDSLLMSCRAMGRGIETALMNHLKAALIESGAERLVGTYIPTPKNVPVARFLAASGFTPVERREDGTEAYELRRADARPQDCSWIEVQS